MSEIFLDIETTGLSFKDNHKIVEIACVETLDLIPTKKIFHKIINPNRSVPDEAFKIHGFSTEFLKDKPSFNEIAEEFLNFIKNKDLIIHNASFDIPFLNHELSLIKKEIITNRRTKHNALLDCDLLREVYINLLDVKEPKLSFGDKSEKKLLNKDIIKYSKAIINLTEKELTNHKEFLKTEMKKNFF